MTTISHGRSVADSAGWSEVIRRLGESIPEPLALRPPKHRRVLFLSLIGDSDLFSIREGLLAHALRLRGAEVTFVLCDGFPVCEARTADNNPQDMCSWCYPKGVGNLTAFGHEAVRLGSLVSPAVGRRLWEGALACPVEELFQTDHRGVSLGHHVYASTLRFFRAGLFDPANPAYVDRARQDLAAAKVSTEAAHQALGSLSIDKLVSNHPVYASWGSWCSTAASMGIPWDTCQGGWRRNTLLCQHNAIRSFHCDDLWPRYRDRALSAGEEQELDHYLATRETNEGDFNPYWTDVDRDLNRLYDRLQLPRRTWKRTLCAFANVSWDAADFESRGAFKSMFSWITQLIEHVARSPDVLLLIKSHPAEKNFIETTPEQWRVADKTRDELGELPENVRFILPGDNVSNFELYGSIDCGLVNTSTVGLEMALAGVPVLMTGVPVHYSHPELVCTPNDREEYFRTLDRWMANGVDFTPDRDRARRYAYTLWFRKSIPFELLDVLQWDAKAICVDSLEELRPGCFPGLDAICDGILNDTAFEHVPASPPR